jgi:hypothetical protein
MRSCPKKWSRLIGQKSDCVKWSLAGLGLSTAPLAAPSIGTRLLAQVDAGLLTRVAHWAGFLSRQEADDSVIRAIAAPRQQKLNQGQVYTDYGGQIGMTLPNIVTRGAGDVGLSVGALGFFPAMDVLRQALPMGVVVSQDGARHQPAIGVAG